MKTKTKTPISTDPLALPCNKKPKRPSSKGRNVKTGEKKQKQSKEVELETHIQNYLAVCRKCDVCDLYFPAPKQALECLHSHGLSRCFACFSTIGKDIVALLEHTRLHHFNAQHPTLVKCPFCPALQSPHSGGLENHVLEEHSESTLMEALLTGNMSLALPRAIPPRALSHLVPASSPSKGDDTEAEEEGMVVCVHPDIVPDNDEQEIDIGELQQMQVTSSVWDVEEGVGDCIILDDEGVDLGPYLIPDDNLSAELESRRSGFDSGFVSTTCSPNDMETPTGTFGFGAYPSMQELQQVAETTMAAEEFLANRSAVLPNLTSLYYDAPQYLPSPTTRSAINTTPSYMLNKDPFFSTACNFGGDYGHQTNYFPTENHSGNPVRGTNRLLTRNGQDIERSPVVIEIDDVIPSTVQQSSEGNQFHNQGLYTIPFNAETRNKHATTTTQNSLSVPFHQPYKMNADSIVERIIHSMFNKEDGSNNVDNNTVVEERSHNARCNNVSSGNRQRNQQSLLKLNNTVMPNPFYKSPTEISLKMQNGFMAEPPFSTNQLSTRDATVAPMMGVRRCSDSISISPVQGSSSSVGILPASFHSAPQELFITPIMSTSTSNNGSPDWGALKRQYDQNRRFKNFIQALPQSQSSYAFGHFLDRALSMSHLEDNRSRN